jgi:hypothetical protein
VQDLDGSGFQIFGPKRKQVSQITVSPEVCYQKDEKAKKLNFITFVGLKARSVNATIMWDVSPCSLVDVY